jgi:hypothetical protein
MRALLGLVAALLCVLYTHGEDKATGRRLLAEKNADTARRAMPSSDQRCVEKALRHLAADHRFFRAPYTELRLCLGLPSPWGLETGWLCVCNAEPQVRGQERR